MAKNLCSLILISLFFSACQSSKAKSIFTPTLEPTQEATPLTSAAPTTMITQSTLITSVSPTVKPEPSATAQPLFTIQPVIHEKPGNIYETVFSIPVGERNIIKYNIPSCCGEIEGPNAIAVLPDDGFMIADSVANRLLHFDNGGRLLNKIELEELGITMILDVRVKGSTVFLLERGRGPDPQKFFVRHLSLEGKLIASDEIPARFPIGEAPYTLEGGLTGIAIDCEGNILLEVEGGSRLFPLSDVQSQPNPDNIIQGYLCDGKRYLVTTPGVWQDPQISVGEVEYRTQLTYGLGGFRFLNVFPDGSFYVVRSDVVTDPKITVDQTVHYVGADGSVLGLARIPLSEFYYPVMRKMAISSKGEVFVLLPRPDSVDIIRLNFYRHLEPLIPGAAVPQITRSTNNP